MSTAKKPKSIHQEIIKDKNINNKAETFIAGAGKESKKKVRENKKPTMIRFDPNTN